MSDAKPTGPGAAALVTKPEKPKTVPPKKVPPKKDPPKKDEPRLATLDDTAIKAMNGKELAALCKLEELPQKGSKDDKLKRLFLKKYGQSDKYVNLMTKCNICQQAVQVQKTDSKPMQDGRTLVTRYVKCVGVRHHTYPLKNIVGKKHDKK